MSDPKEQDRLLEHEYDGIREYDNPLPRWWLGTLWATIVFSILYILNVPVVGKGEGRIAEYQAEMAEAARLAAANDPFAGITDETLVAITTDPARLDVGAKTFTTMCASCHQPDGSGLIGPNLTDRHWLHGNKPLEIMKVVNEGVPSKGMPAWGKILKPDQLTAVAAYVVSFRNQPPKNGKAPEGIEIDPGQPAAK